MLKAMPSSCGTYRRLAQGANDTHFNDGPHGVTSKLLYKLLTLLIFSVFIPAITIMVVAAMDITMSKHEMVCLNIFSLGCPTVAIVVVACIVLWRFEVAQMENYELAVL